MRHEAHDVAPHVADARHVVQGAVRIASVSPRTVGAHVAEDDLVPREHLLVHPRLGGPVPVGVRDGHAEDVALVDRERERGAFRFHAQENVLAHEAEAFVSEHRSRQEPGLAQDLEAVADAENSPALPRERRDGFHHRREARHRAAPEVVPVRESSREDHEIGIAERALVVPHHLHVRPEHVP